MNLPLLFTDQEPNPKIQRYLKYKELYFFKIVVEEPHKRQKVSQCKRCQNYRHIKKYCNYQSCHVKCTGLHSIEDCIKEDLPATCVLYGGSHPANYRGCEVLKISSGLKKANRLQHPITYPPIIAVCFYPFALTFPLLDLL